MCMEKTGCWRKGSFTVEVSLIMGIVLMVLVAILYLSFYVQDGGVAQGIVCELAAVGNCAALVEDGEKQMEKRKKLLITSRFLHTEGVKVSMSTGDTRMGASIQGKFAIPGFIGGFFTDGELPVSKSWNRIIYDPADIIRKIRGVAYMVEGIGD